MQVDKPDFSIVAAYSKIYGLSFVPGGQGIAGTGAVMGQIGVASIKQYGGALSRGLVLDTDGNFYQASIVARSIFTSGIQGGASYANAGDGGTVNTDGSVDAAGAGDNGAALTTSVDPINLL